MLLAFFNPLADLQRRHGGPAFQLPAARQPAALPEVTAWLNIAGAKNVKGYAGAWRDAQLQRPARDIDLIIPVAFRIEENSFIDAADSSPPRIKGEDFNRLQKQLLAGATGHEVPYEGQPQRQLFTLASGAVCDVLFTQPRHDRPAAALAAEADVGLSAIAMDFDSNTVWAMPSFLSDYTNRTISTRRPMTLQRRAEYLARLGQRYPDFKIQVS